MSLSFHAEGPESARLLVVLQHGFGASADDLVPVAQEMERLEPRLVGQVRWLFPGGLLALPEGGPYARAWWMIPARQWEAMETRNEAFLAPLRDAVPNGMEDARAQLMELLAAHRRPGQALVLGGFSQGATLSTDVALRITPPPQALVLFSGSLVNASVWKALAPGRKEMRVFQSHGLQDPVLPFQDAERVRDLLQGGGLTVDFMPFRGGHALPLQALQRTAALLASCVIK